MHLSNTKRYLSVISYSLFLFCSVHITISKAQVTKTQSAVKSSWQANLKRMYLFTDINDAKGSLEYTPEGKFSIRSMAANKVIFTGDDINRNNGVEQLTEHWVYIIDPAGSQESKKKENLAEAGPKEVKAAEKDFSVYPNPIDPARKEITLGLEDFENGKEIQMSLFDGQGRVINQQSFTLKDKKQTVAIPQLPSGMYYVKINETQAQYSRKLLVR